MILKKHKIIALATAGVATATTLVSAGAIISSNVASNIAKERNFKQNLHAAAREDFKWDGNTILGLADGKKPEEVIVGGELIIPTCDEIADDAFDYTFKNISGVFTIKIPYSTTRIGNNAFLCNSKIEKIIFYQDSTLLNAPKLETIGESAFEKCEALTTFTIPLSCKTIGDSAFYKCSNLSEINLSTRDSLLTGIGNHAFYGIADEGKLIVDSAMSQETANAIASNFTTSEYGRVDFDKATQPWVIMKSSTKVDRIKTVPTLYLNINDKNVLSTGLKRGNINEFEALYIPQNVVEIADHAFDGADHLTSLAFEDHSACTTIGNYAFSGCTNLVNSDKTLKLPSAIKNIGWYAFFNCNKFENIDLSSIKYGNRSRTFSIGSNAFGGWNTLLEKKDRVKFPEAESSTEGLTQDQINQIFINALNVTGCLPENFFANADNPIDPATYEKHVEKKLIQVEGDEKWEYTLTGFNWSGLQVEQYDTLKIEKGVTGVGDNAFFDEDTKQTKLPTSITKIDMSNADIKQIGENAFRGSNIKTVVFSDKTTTIGDGAFQDCKNLEGVTLPESIESIGANAFKGCDNAYYIDLSKLTNEDLQDIIKNKSIGDGAFDNFGVLKEAGGTIIWPADIDDDTKSGFVNLLVKAGLSEGWVKEETSEDGYTGGIPIKYGQSTILEIDEDTKELMYINWANLDAYVKALEEKTHVTVESLPLIIPKSVKSIAQKFWANGDTTAPAETIERLSKIVNKLSFAANSECESIGDNAFASASNFTGSLILPNKLKTIGENAFESCSGFDSELSIPKSIDINGGIGPSAFQFCSNFKSVDVSSWDLAYVQSWGESYPVSNLAFGEWSNDSIALISNEITADKTAELEAIKTGLCEIGKLPTTAFGTDIQSYTSLIDPIDITSILEGDETLRTVDNDEKKQKVLDYYIDVINNGITIGTKHWTGAEILENDLKMSFKNAAINSPAFNPSSTVINVRLKNVEAHGNLIDFDIVANVNVYSEQYSYGIVSQFSTSVKNLMLTTVSSKQSTDFKQTAMQVGVNFEACGDTVITTTYDKQYLHGTSSSGQEFKKQAVDVTNKTFSFRQLINEYPKGVEYDSTTTKATKLHTLVREEFYSAPSLFGLVLGAYSYSDLYNLTNGCKMYKVGDDEFGILYAPYMGVRIASATEKYYSNKPMSGQLTSIALGNFNVFDVTSDSGVTTYKTNSMNYNNCMKSAEEAQWSTVEETVQKYGAYLYETSSSYTPQEGQLFREEILNSIISALRSFFESAKPYCKYIETDDIEFYNVKDANGNVMPVIRREGTEGNYEYYASYGVKINVWIHNDIFKTGVDGDNNPISDYTISTKICLPIEMRNVKLNSRYFFEQENTTRVNGALWSLFDTSTTSKESSMTLGESSEGVGPILRMVEYNQETSKFVVTQVIDNHATYNFDEINTEMRNLGIHTLAEADSYMASKWKLLKYLNFIRSDLDDSNFIHVSLGYNSNYMKNIKW